MKSYYEKDMYRQMEELFAKIAELELTVEQQAAEIKRRNAENADLLATVKTLDAKLDKREAELSEIKEELSQSQEKVEKLTTENALLKAEISRIKSQNNNNSSNSSNPPSSDQTGGKRANSYNSRRKTGRKAGGQKGHKGTTLNADEAEELIASGKCKHSVVICGNPASGKYGTKYELDVNIEAEVIEYRIYEGADSDRFPHNNVFYGPKLKALVSELYGIGVVSAQRIKEIVSSITNGCLNVSTGTIYGFCRELSARIQPVLSQIETHILDGEVAYTDATVISINGKQAYIRNVSNDEAVRYYALEKKNLHNLHKIELLCRFAGILVHDHETSLYHFGTDHAECNVHILRYLQKNVEDCSTSWAAELSRLFYEMKSARDKLSAGSGIQQMPQEMVENFTKRYDEIIRKGYKENETTRPTWAKKDERALLNRLVEYKKNHLLFLERFDVAFSNNTSERDLRKCKSRQNLTGGFRSLLGCKMYADILSLIETAKRLGLNVYNLFLNAFQSDDPIALF